MRRQSSKGRYAEFKADWEAVRSQRKPIESDLSLPRIEHIVTSGRLQEELMLLYTETRDPRFIGALDALCENDLLDERGRWRPRYISPHLSLCHRSHEAICAVSVWKGIKEFNSLRLACAFLVSHWQSPGQSFEAACKELERLYRSYVKAGVDFGQLADEISSNDGYLRM